jgi:hypothetical protein
MSCLCHTFDGSFKPRTTILALVGLSTKPLIFPAAHLPSTAAVWLCGATNDLSSRGRTNAAPFVIVVIVVSVDHHCVVVTSDTAII